MKRLLLHLLVGWTIAAALASCRPSRPAPERNVSRAEGTPFTPHPAAEAVRGSLDSATVTPHRSLLDKVLRREPKPYTVKSTDLKVGKKSTVNIYHGPATVTTTTVAKKATAATGEGAVAVAAEKKAGPVVVADSGADVRLAVAKEQAAAGEGIDQRHEETKQSWLAALLPWVGGLGGAAVLYWLLFGGGGALLLALFRRNKSTNNQA